MNRIKVLFCAILLTMAFGAEAQFTQLGRKSEFMLKLEAGYYPFMTNSGTAGENGYALSHYESAAVMNFMLGRNISQDWFLGAGLGVDYFHSFSLLEVDPTLGANVFVDFDFRPIWQGVMGVDYQPVTIKWAPVMGGRLGGNLLLGDGGGFSAMAEMYAGINWYYAHGLHNMEHNWHSLYATIGVAYMQQTFFLPIKVGWRW